MQRVLHAVCRAGYYVCVKTLVTFGIISSNVRTIDPFVDTLLETEYDATVAARDAAAWIGPTWRWGMPS
jgi:hypothetical protein